MPENNNSIITNGLLGIQPLSENKSTLSVNWKDTNASRYVNDPNWKMLGYDMNRNNEYAYENAQTTGEWWKNTAKRFLHPLTTSFVGGFDYLSTARELWTGGTEAENENLKEHLKKSEELNYLYPNYDNPNSSDEGFFSYFNAGARNKWSSLIESSGFMMGTAAAGIAQSIILGMVTGGVGSVAALAKTADTTSKAYRFSKLASAYKQIDKVNDLWRTSKLGKLVGASPTLQAIDGLTDISKAKDWLQFAKATGKFLGNSAIRFQATSSEAMLEAIEGSEHFKKQQIEQFELKNGREATKEEKDDIENYAADVFSARYRANLGVLSVTNLVQDLSFFNTYKYISKLGKSGAIAEEAAKKWSWNAKAGIAMKHSALPLKERALFEAKAIGNSFFKNAFMEGIEEGAQYAIGKSTEDYYTKKYNKESASFMDSMAKGLSATFLDKEGRESFWSGIMMGGLFSTVGKGAKTVHGIATGKGAKIDAMVSEQITNYNQAHKNLIETFKTEQVLSSEAENGTLNHVNNTLIEDALENNDPDRAKELRLQSLRNSVKTAKEVGKIDLLKKSLLEYGDLQDDVFREKFGVTSKKTNKEIVEETLRDIEEIEKTVDAVNERYGNPYDGYDNIDPITAADKRVEQHNLYKGYEEAKMTVIDNVETLKESKRNLSKISEWFTGQGVVVEDVLAELVPEQILIGGVEFDSAELTRKDKLNNLSRQLADLEKLKQTSTDTSEIIRATQSQAELLKEIDVYINLNNNPDSLGAILDYFNFQIGKSKKGLPIDATNSTEFKTSLEENIKGLRDNLEKSKNALEALDALEKLEVFEGLAKDYAKAYDKRYGQIISDLDANEQEAKAATEEVAPEETPEETIGTPVTPESPVETISPSEPEEGPIFSIPPYAPKQNTKPQPKHVLLRKIVQVEKELDEITHVTNSLLSTKVRLTNLLQKEIAELNPVLEKLARTVIDSNTMYFISNYEELRDAEIRLQAEVDKLTDELNIVSEELARVEKVRDYIRNKLTYYNQLRKEPGIRSVNYENIIYGKIQLLETKLKFLTSLINKVKKAISRMMDDLRYVAAQLRQNEADIINYPLDTEVDAELTTNREKRAPLQQEFTKQKNRVKALSRTVENTKDTIKYLYDLLEWGERTNSEEIDTPIEEIKAPKLQTLTDNISNEEKEKLIESKEEQIKKIDELIQQKTDEVLGADGIMAEIEKEESSTSPNQARLQVLYEKRDKLQKETAALATKKETVKNRFGKEIVKEEKYIIDSQEQVQNTLNEDLDVSSKIVKSVYLSGLHYVQTEDGKYYVVPNVSEGSDGITSKEVTQAEIIKPFRTKKEWDELEAKKADIERRRQEDLKDNSRHIFTSSELFIDENGDHYKIQNLSNGKKRVSVSDENGKTLTVLDEYEQQVSNDAIIAGGLTKVKDLKFTNKVQDEINAKYDAELATLGTSVTKIDSPEVVQLKSAKKSLTLEIDTLMEEPSIEVLDVPSNENNVVQGLSGSEINNLATSIINSPNVFFAGMVFRTAGEDMVKRGDTFTLISERSPIGILRAKIRNAIMRRSIGSSKTLSDIGIHITIQKDKDEFHPEGETARERQFFLDNKDKPSHPVVAVLTDINGETLYFDEDGDKTTKEKGTPIVQQIFEVDVDTASRTLQGRKEDRIQERIRVLTLQNLFSGVEITPEDVKRITDEVNEEFRMLSELKSHIRNTDEKITVNNASISRGFTEKNNIVLVPNDALVDKENAKVSVETVTINNGGTNVTKGIVYYNGFPMFMPKLSEGSLFDTIKTILQTRVPYDSFERSSRQAFLRKILYRRTEEHPKAVTKVSYDYENEKIVVMSGEQILSLEELMSRNLSLNVDKQLFDENQSFVEYVAKPEFNDRDERMPNMKLVALPAVPYQDYIKSKGYVFMTESELESQTKKLGPTPRYNIVFGMNPSETMSKITPVSTETNVINPNDLLSVDDLLSEETTPEVGTALQNAFAVFTPPSVPSPKQKFNVGDKFKLLSKSLSQEKGSPVYVEIKLIEEIPNTTDDVKFSVEQTYQGVSTMRTYKSSTIEQGLSNPLAEKLESAETLNVFDMFTETTPIDEVMDRELIKSGVLKKGTTMEDLINTLISRNIVEKICKF